MSGIWIFSERRDSLLELLVIAGELAGTIKTHISLLLCFEHDRATDYISHGADEVLLLPPLETDQTFDAYIPLIVHEARQGDPDLMLFSATATGKDLAARIAARLDTGLCSNCMGIRFNETQKTFEMDRLAYGGIAIQKVTCTSRPAMATFPPGTFTPSTPREGRQGVIRKLPAPSPSPTKIVEREKEERVTKDISEARIIVCVGRGFEKKEDIELARELAEIMGGEIACTRPIAEEYHWLPEELCIGLSGVQVKPDLYIGLGVSGQVQHMTGVRNARIIAAVNKDENAPIFTTSDLGIVGDLYDVVPKLIAHLKK